MLAAVLNKVGCIDDIQLVEAPIPVPKNDECLIRVIAAALNHRDYWIVQGKYAKIKTPAILGSDICGVIEQVGKNASPDLLGQTVIVNPSLGWGTDERAQAMDYRILGMPDQGGLAQYVCVPAGQILPKPGHLAPEQAAALPLAGLTAYRALFVRGMVTASDVVLVTGVGGGVASLVLQLALASGCKVIVTSSDDSKLLKAKHSGAYDGVNYRLPDWTSKLQAIAARVGGISLVVDGAGGEPFSELVGLLRPGGRLVTYGATLGNPGSIDLRKIFWKQLTLLGSTMGTAADFHAMVEWIERFKIVPVVDSVFPLAGIRSAFHRMATGQQYGKIVVKP